jgi:hypothetical protein
LRSEERRPWPRVQRSLVQVLRAPLGGAKGARRPRLLAVGRGGAVQVDGAVGRCTRSPRDCGVFRLRDGRLVVAGGLENGTRGVSQGAFVSYQKSGAVDAAFGLNGLVLDKALTTEFRYTTAFGRIFGLTRTADGYALTAYKNAAGEIDFSWGGTGLVTGRYPSTVGKATTIAVTTRSGQAKLLVGGIDGSGTGSRFFAARFQLGCVNIRACTVGVQTSGRVGRVPFGPQRKGRIRITWDYKLNGKRLPGGRSARRSASRLGRT